MFKKLLFSLTFAGAAAFGQIELVQNNWPTDPQGHKFFPDATVTFESRLYSTATNAGVAGFPFTYTIKQYAGQGYHTHETDHGTFISRPDPYIESGEQGITDSAGMARMTVELNGYSGWYTVCATIKDPNNILVTLFMKCVNINPRYYTRYFGTDIYLERYSGGLTLGANDTNQPQSLHWDRRHVCANMACPVGGYEGSQMNSDGYTGRWATHNTHLRLLGASVKYRTDTANAGLPDLLDITSISLPDGGIRDNDVAGVAPGAGYPATLNNDSANWRTRVYEEHARGVEADIVMVTNATQQPLEFAALYFAGCLPGINQPEGQRIVYNPPDPFWKFEGVVHTICERQGLASKPIIH